MPWCSTFYCNCWCVGKCWFNFKMRNLDDIDQPKWFIWYRVRDPSSAHSYKSSIELSFAALLQPCCSRKLPMSWYNSCFQCNRIELLSPPIQQEVIEEEIALPLIFLLSNNGSVDVAIRCDRTVDGFCTTHQWLVVEGSVKKYACDDGEWCRYRFALLHLHITLLDLYFFSGAPPLKWCIANFAWCKNGVQESNVCLSLWSQFMCIRKMARIIDWWTCHW